MKRIAGLLFLACALFVCSCNAPTPPEGTGGTEKACCSAGDVRLPEGDWLGQTPPGMEPQLFAPDFVSTALYERDIVFTPDGNTCYFGLMGRNHSALVVSRRVDGQWSEPTVSSFSTDPAIFDLEPHITPDGSQFLFLSTRPADGSEPTPGWHDQDIWAMDRAADSWGAPYNLGSPVNSEAPEYFPSTTRDGTIYFSREVMEEGLKRSLIMRCRMVDGVYQPVEVLPPEVNAGDMQFNGFIDPDERYLIFGMAGQADAVGMADYYITFRDRTDTWTGPIHMGEPFNTPGNSVVSASLSPDGRYLFFASTRAIGDQHHSWRGYRERHGQPGNGNSDIYWVDAAVIEALRPE